MSEKVFKRSKCETLGISLRVNDDAVFQASESKNPLKVMLSEGHIFKTLAVIASSVMGTGLNEPEPHKCAGGAQALPACHGRVNLWLATTQALNHSGTSDLDRISVQHRNPRIMREMEAHGHGNDTDQW